jgi:hypothetical protein
MQVVLVIFVVLIAVFYLGKKAYHAFFSKDVACDSCAFSKMTLPQEQSKK